MTLADDSHREYPATPTLDHVKELQERSQAIGDFLEWCGEQGYFLCSIPVKELWYPISKGANALLHAFYEIDAQAEDAEKLAVLEYVRADTAVREASAD